MARIEWVEVPINYSFLSEFDKKLISLCTTRGLVLAGGYARFLHTRERDTSDIDLFYTPRHVLISSQDVINVFSNTFKVKASRNLEYLHTFYIEETPKPVQIVIKSGYWNALSILETFDLPVCEIAINNPKYFVCTKEYLKNLETNNLSIREGEFRKGNFFSRVMKYVDKGFDLEFKDILYLLTLIKKNDHYPEGSLLYTESNQDVSNREIDKLYAYCLQKGYFNNPLYNTLLESQFKEIGEERDVIFSLDYN